MMLKGQWQANVLCEAVHSVRRDLLPTGRMLEGHDTTDTTRLLVTTKRSARRPVAVPLLLLLLSF